MPFRGVLAIWLAHWQHFCVQWVLKCLVHDVVPQLDVDGVVEALNGQSVLSSCSPHSRGCFMQI